jgi:hypothetical protein
MNGGWDSSCRVPASEAQGPVFKLQSHKKKKKFFIQPTSEGAIVICI